jgi:hypothetical protein
VGERLLAGDPFARSNNPYDWLGTGIYFWEANPLRGLRFAEYLRDHPRGPGNVAQPYVVGAIIDYGYCLDLLSATGVEAVATAYDDFRLVMEAAKSPLPRNRLGEDLLLRYLDCAVVNHLHAIWEQQPFDTVRGAFREGQPLYENAGFHAETHVQICVRNSDCIKGVFRVRGAHLNMENSRALGTPRTGARSERMRFH